VLKFRALRTERRIRNNVDGATGYYAQRNMPGREIQVSSDLTHLWSVRTKPNLKAQKSSSLTEPERGLTDPKGKRTGRGGPEGREKGNKGH